MSADQFVLHHDAVRKVDERIDVGYRLGILAGAEHESHGSGIGLDVSVPVLRQAVSLARFSPTMTRTLNCLPVQLSQGSVKQSIDVYQSG
ncbi:hypothetical protein [Micromonospora sp. NPDC023888]|uniref:hypothetical protein n=1 Tax=Micromonospora sp. NPDC023888 TaxID=3155607 RepID=UPI00340B1673